MGLLNSISKTASNIGQKGKDVANTAKLNHQISEEEKRIEKLYEEIGKQYCQLHGEDYEDAFTEFMLAMHESEEKINSLKAEVHALQGLVKCPHCGEDIPLGTAFCPKCGGKIEETTEEE